MLGNRYMIVAAGFASFFLAGFLTVEAFGVPWLSTPPSLTGQARPVAAAIGVALLLADAVLPVPSSLVMLALGGIFDVPAGAALALAGRVGATLLAFALGRRISGWVTGPAGEWSAQMLRRWGVVAIVLTRPVPIASETVAVMAGASPMPWRFAAIAAVAGSIPEAVLFAWAGAQAEGNVLGAVLWCSLIVVAIAVSASGHFAGRVVKAAKSDGKHPQACS